jgi:hypothetical protein
MAVSAVEVGTLAKGYIKAHDRLNAEIVGDRTLEEIFLPLYETLHWLVSVDEQEHLSRMREIPRELKGALKGLRLARNLTGHRWGMALERRDILVQLQAVRPGRPGIHGRSLVAAWCWCPAKQLPRPDRRHRGKKYRSGRWHYTHWLAGEQASSALTQIRPYVERLIREDPVKAGKRRAGRTFSRGELAG